MTKAKRGVVERAIAASKGPKVRAWDDCVKEKCPVCGSDIPGLPSGSFSATVRCRGCDSSIGLPELSVVFLGDGAQTKKSADLD